MAKKVKLTDTAAAAKQESPQISQTPSELKPPAVKSKAPAATMGVEEYLAKRKNNSAALRRYLDHHYRGADKTESAWDAIMQSCMGRKTR